MVVQEPRVVFCCWLLPIGAASISFPDLSFPTYSVTVVVLLAWDYSGQVKDLLQGFKQHVFSNKYETLKMAVPSVVYALQVCHCTFCIQFVYSSLTY